MVATHNSPTTNSVVYLHPDDNICIASSYVAGGSTVSVNGQKVTIADPIRLGHKIAIRPIAKGEPVRKYGQIIGFTTEAIKPGEWVHSHNLGVHEFERDPAPSTQIPAPQAPIAGRTFQGFRRANGRAGTRNYVAVISTVNCSASVSKYVSRRFDPQAVKREFPNVDGVIGITHQSGCAMQYNGIGHQMLARVLGGIAKHPNVGAYLLIGLGCETATMGYLLDHQKLVQIDGTRGDRRGPPVFSMQDQGGTMKTVEAAVQKVRELLPIANDIRRQPIPASELILGTECGGSDGNSGITANPALGVAADMVVACGGTSILSETTEIYGAEHLLTRRAVTPAIAKKLLDRIEWWKWYTSIFGAEIDNNPSAGNKEGGLTTIVEKSLGAVAKGGSCALVDVYEYAQEVTAKGFVVMDTPGFDPTSVVGLVAGGANMIVFTTGRGSCYGCKPVPSIKVATNTPMYERMIDDMDLNAGEILRGQRVEDVGREIFEEILEVASGKQTKSEIHGIGEEEFVPWFVGPTL